MATAATLPFGVRGGTTVSHGSVDDADVETPQRRTDAQHDGVFARFAHSADIDHVLPVDGRQDDEDHLIEVQEGLDDSPALCAHLDGRQVLPLDEHDAARVAGAGVHLPAEHDRHDRDGRLVAHG